MHTLVQNVVRYAEARDLEVCMAQRSLEQIGANKDLVSLIKQQNSEIVQLQIESKEAAVKIRQLENEATKKDVFKSSQCNECPMYQA